MSDFFQAGRDGLRGLRRFSGRSPRTTFWCYMLWLFIGYQAVSLVVGLSVAIRGFLFAEPFYSGGALTDAGSGSNNAVMFAIATFIGVLPFVVIGLTAAAVTRRLHDSGLRGWWAVPTALLLLAGTVSFAFLFGAPDAPDESWFRLIFAINAAYLVSLLVLFILLCRGSTPGSNRFGPPPSP